MRSKARVCVISQGACTHHIQHPHSRVGSCRKWDYTRDAFQEVDEMHALMAQLSKEDRPATSQPILPIHSQGGTNNKSFGELQERLLSSLHGSTDLGKMFIIIKRLPFIEMALL
eukprot:1187932-Amphidinium_carterae.2